MKAIPRFPITKKLDSGGDEEHPSKKLEAGKNCSAAGLKIALLQRT